MEILKTEMNLQVWQTNKERNHKEIILKTGTKLQEWQLNKEWSHKEIILKTEQNLQEVMFHKNQKPITEIPHQEIQLPAMSIILQETVTEDLNNFKTPFKTRSFRPCFF